MTLELLHKDHASVLRNPVLAELLYLTGYIEHWGTGIRNMKTWMEEYGLSEPEYREIDTHFITTLKRSTKEKGTEGGQKSGQISGQKKWSDLTKRQIELVNLIRYDPKISRKELSLKLGINPSAIQKHLEKLKDKGILERVGPSKGGYWDVRLNND